LYHLEVLRQLQVYRDKYMAFSNLLSTIFANGNRVTDEKFAYFYAHDSTVIQVLNNGRSIKNVRAGVYTTALGAHSYSSGIYHIRLHLEKGRATFGIRSRNIPPELDELATRSYTYSSSMYGWIKDCGRVFDGEWYRYRYSDDDELREGGFIYTITLNCDEHRLTMIDEDTRKQDSIEVDLPRMFSAVSLL